MPEAGLMDVSFGNVAIELKTVNTNYRDKFRIADPMFRPITENVNGVIQDIEKHRRGKSAHEHKFVIFVVFPLDKDGHDKWNSHLFKIEAALGSTCRCEFFNFSNSAGKISGCLYYGKVCELTRT